MSKTTITSKSYLRIGQIAQRSGVSAKALRLYEQRGLLKPCAHSEAGYRLYGPDALRRLMQIVVLKRSGFSLAQIGRLLERDAKAAAHLLAARIATLERDLADRTQALATLRRMERRMGSASTLDLDQLLESIYMGSTLKVDLSDAERAAFEKRAEQLGSEGMEAAQNEWPRLIAQVRAAMDAGTPATEASAVSLARRWHALIVAATGNDAAVNRKIGQAWQAQPDAMAAQGMDPAMFRYIGAAMAAAGLSLAR
ncbi:MAG TPA: MerR family transcriptional regulator [Xanthomonadaceae bacterium]|jgi:DNA-binding transcriptional MerR regulator|nr:MerR family transcriptional regulator [Xanthomonadaceae bacterium]